MDDAQGAIDQMTAEEKQRFAMSQPEAGEGPKMTHEQVKQIAAEPLQEIMWPMLEAELSAFAAVNIKFGILSHDDDLGFVTSDSPCVWYDPEAALMPPIYRDVGVGSPTVEITLPITPNSAVILSHQDHLTGYIPISESMVHVLNRRTIFHCDEEFVCSRPKTHPYWFFGMNRGIIAPEPNEQAPPV